MKRLPNESQHNVTSHGYIDMLHNILPPQAIIHIGAGGGEGEMHLWKQWDVPHALIIDAEAARLEWANTLHASHPDWHVLDTVVSDVNGKTDFYQATNPSEDGLIPAENLVAIWPNLRTVAQTSRPTIRLETLLAEQRYSALEQSRSIWAIIDCLPVLPILQGAGANINHWSVLWLRALLKPLDAIEESATLQAIESFLEPLGYRCIHVAEGNHPAIGTAIFIRDWQAVLNPQIEQLTQTQVNQAQLIVERLATIESLTSELQAQTQQLADTQTQIEVMANDGTGLHEEKLILTQQRDALQSELTGIKQERDEQAKLAADRQGQVVQLTQARDEQVKLVSERHAQVQALTQEKTTLANQKAELITARDAQSQLVAERQVQIVQLTQARDEQDNLAGKRYTQIQALTQEKAALANEKAELITARDAQARLAAERQAKVEQLTQARDEQANLADKRYTQIEQLKQKQDELQTTNSEQLNRIASLATEVTNLTQALAQSQKAIKEKEERIDSLDEQLTETCYRQSLLSDEMIKAEAQIDLIKDVLLREPGL